jgi:hypothetical protein
MSRAHVPPQAAGNDSQVRRNYFISGEGGMTPGRSTEGGMWVYGLCGECNNRAGSLYDQAYADLATGTFELAPHRSIVGRIPLVEVRTPTDQFREEDAAQLQIMSHRELKIQRSDFRYEALPFDIDIPVATFLKDGPGYVRHVLTVFAQIHKGLESGATEFWRNQSIAF